MQTLVRLPKDCRPDTTRVWFVPDDTPYFYWLVPESAEREALGVIGEQTGADTKRRFERFLEKEKPGAARVAGRANPGLPKMDPGSPPNQQWRRVPRR